MATQSTTRAGNGGFLGHVQQMIETHPERSPVAADELRACIEACFDCAQACIACADACLSESDPKELSRCIRLNQDCADACEVTGKSLSRQTEFDGTVAAAFLRTCIEVCRICAEECARHAKKHEHCRVCEEACRRCEQACRRLQAE